MHTTHQTTLRKKATLHGVGLHSGKKTTCVIHPSPANNGIHFVRTDLNVKIRADISRVMRTEMSTTIGCNEGSVSTVEHLMAALYGLGVDNALIEIDGPEVPILDGSAREFALAIADAGIRQLGSNKKVMYLKKPISIHNGDKWIAATPSEDFVLKGQIQFKHHAIGNQSFQFSQKKDFIKELASARTFGFIREVEYLHKKGLALGASLENAIVLNEDRVLNPEGLRFKNEFIRHKILDAVGDFALLGMPFYASIELNKAGHDLHAAFLRKILDDPTNYEICELESYPAIEHTPLIRPALAY